MIGSLPMMLFGILLFSGGSLFYYFVMNAFDNQFFSWILIVSSLYALIIILIYQGGRQLVLREVKKLLKDTYMQPCLRLAKDLDFYIDKPDIVTSAIIIGLPVLSFLLRYLFEVV